MSILKYITRLKRMDRLIKLKATGTPDEFADKLEISRSTLLANIKELKLLGASIDYDRTRATYVYEDNSCMELRFKSNALNNNVLNEIKAGRFTFFRRKSHSLVLDSPSVLLSGYADRSAP